MERRPDAGPADAARNVAPGPEIAVTVKLFARARDLAGADAVVLAVPAPVTVGAVRQALLAQYPRVSSLPLLAAVDADYASDDRVAPPGCELAFFPPVSGG